MYNDFFGTSIKPNDLALVTVTVNRNPTAILGRVVKVTETKHENGWVNQTLSMYSISDPNGGAGWWASHLRDGGYSEAGRLVKCGDLSRVVIVNDLAKAMEYADANEALAQAQEADRITEKARVRAEEKAEREKEKARVARKTNRDKGLRASAKAKLSPAEKRALGVK